MSDAAAWVQAIGSIIAIFVAVAVPAWQRRTVRRDSQDELDQKEHQYIQRLTAAFRAEISQAVACAGHMYIGVKSAREAIIEALSNSAQFKDSGPLPVTAVVITEANIYRSLATEIGRFPPQLITEIVSFYETASETCRLATMGASIKSSTDELFGALPRIRMCGAIIVKKLDRYQAAGFCVDADFCIGPDEIKAWAAEFEYPLDEIIKEEVLRDGVGISFPHR